MNRVIAVNGTQNQNHQWRGDLRITRNSSIVRRVPSRYWIAKLFTWSAEKLPQLCTVVPYFRSRNRPYSVKGKSSRVSTRAIWNTKTKHCAHRLLETRRATSRIRAAAPSHRINPTAKIISIDSPAAITSPARSFSIAFAIVAGGKVYAVLSVAAIRRDLSSVGVAP